MKYFLLHSKNVERDSLIWNMAGSLLMAFQSVIFLMILTRTVGLTMSGIFTLAYANANLFLNIGKYGMRNYQVSDVKNEFSFQDYLNSRWITTIAMMVVSMGYIVFTAYTNQYSIEKTQIILWMCIFKVSDSIEDVYYGDYQKKGRLDVASKAMTLRMIFTIIGFSILAVVTRDLLITLITSTIFTTVLMFIFLRWTCEAFKENTEKKKGKAWKLLKYCFPVFLSAFFAFYIGNAPKYAIDTQLSDEIQACYGFISMPVFVIGLLNNFVFTPMIYKLSCLWNEGKSKDCLKMILFQVVIVFGITCVCIMGAYIFGIPVLSLLYNADLAPYKYELLILLLGGGFLGLSGVLCTVITIMRYQTALVFGYGVVVVFALLFSNRIVEQYGLMGASVLYLLLMILLCLCFCFILQYGLIRQHKKNENTK